MTAGSRGRFDAVSVPWRSGRTLSGGGALLWGPFFIFLVPHPHINQMFIMFAALGLLGPISYLLGRRKLEA